MPTFMTEAVARALYSSPVPQTVINGVVQNPQPPITYGPEYLMMSVQQFDRRRDMLVGRGLTNALSILVVGCGYGSLMKVLADSGITNAYGLEPGSWIQDNLVSFQPDPDIRSRIGDDWIGSGTEQATLNALGATGQAKFKFVIDEDAATAHTDAELPLFIASLEDRLQGNLEGLKVRIVHMVSVLRVEQGPGDSSQNWKTLADWKAVAPSHTWVDRQGNVG